jgi:hypothetical protein
VSATGAATIEQHWQKSVTQKQNRVYIDNNLGKKQQLRQTLAINVLPFEAFCCARSKLRCGRSFTVLAAVKGWVKCGCHSIQIFSGQRANTVEVLVLTDQLKVFSKVKPTLGTVLKNFIREMSNFRN